MAKRKKSNVVKWPYGSVVGRNQADLDVLTETMRNDPTDLITVCYDEDGVLTVVVPNGMSDQKAYFMLLKAANIYLNYGDVNDITDET